MTGHPDLRTPGPEGLLVRYRRLPARFRLTRTLATDLLWGFVMVVGVVGIVTFFFLFAPAYCPPQFVPLAAHNFPFPGYPIVCYPTGPPFP
jgi:hypothetical protein